MTSTDIKGTFSHYILEYHQYIDIESLGSGLILRNNGLNSSPKTCGGTISPSFGTFVLE